MAGAHAGPLAQGSALLGAAVLVHLCGCQHQQSMLNPSLEVLHAAKLHGAAPPWGGATAALAQHEGGDGGGGDAVGNQGGPAARLQLRLGGAGGGAAGPVGASRTGGGRAGAMGNEQQQQMRRLVAFLQVVPGLLAEWNQALSHAYALTSAGDVAASAAGAGPGAANDAAVRRSVAAAARGDAAQPPLLPPLPPPARRAVSAAVAGEAGPGAVHAELVRLGGATAARLKAAAWGYQVRRACGLRCSPPGLSAASDDLLPASARWWLAGGPIAQDDWKQRPGAPTQSLDVAASLSDTRTRDQQLVRGLWLTLPLASGAALHLRW